MRIVIDLQGAQSSGSRNRGIGRYSIALSKAIVMNRSDHEILIAVSEMFPGAADDLISSFQYILPRENIHVWAAPGPVNYLESSNDWRRLAAEALRETFLASLNPDFVLVTSLFEGSGDDAVTSVGTRVNAPSTAVILYDLIPFIYRSPYLDDPGVEKWYLEKIEHIRRADLCLAISGSSQQEGVKYLGMSDERCVAISTDAEPHFGRINISAERERDLRRRYALDRPFVMYTGGIDHRKNIEGLIKAYAKLPPLVREKHRLAIVCSVSPGEKARLEARGLEAGLSPGDLVMTGFVPEDDLVALYNLCTAFIFPSWHEGFGLPVLEAMRCGACVIGANTSSIPEVIGFEEALFDPRSEASIADSLLKVLTDENFRSRLKEHSEAHAQHFSWDRSARTAIAAMERLHEKARPLASLDGEVRQAELPRLAFVSPLPPAESGIADYSRELLRALSKHYRIDVIVEQSEISDGWILSNCGVHSPDWLVANADKYQRVLYHFGNSHFHQHMFGLLDKVPGVVVLHDFFLSGIIAHLDATGVTQDGWLREIYYSHGYTALKRRYGTVDRQEIVWAYPCSGTVVKNSMGVIAHSEISLKMAQEWYGEAGSNFALIPLLREMREAPAKLSVRQELGLKDTDFVVCSFGMISATKHSARLAKVWQKTHLARDPDCCLIFVGGDGGGAAELEKVIADTSRTFPANIKITGRVDTEVFQNYLSATDMAVQLRTLSRGETSAAVLDCMSHGKATIVNANGSMAYLDENAVLRLPDEFTDEQLAEALERLRMDYDLRQCLGKAGRDVIRKEHDPARCAEQYRDAIERFYERASVGWRSLPAAIGALPTSRPDRQDLLRFSMAMAQNFPEQPRQKQFLVDISALVHSQDRSSIWSIEKTVLLNWLSKSVSGFRVEPIYSTSAGQYRYARTFTCRFLGCPDNILREDVVEFARGDVFFGFDPPEEIAETHAAFYKHLQRHNVQVVFGIGALQDELSAFCHSG